MSAPQPDFEHDSLASLLFAQAERIRELEEIAGRQGRRCVELTVENAALREDADPVVEAELDRLSDGLWALEVVFLRWRDQGWRWLHTGDVIHALRDVSEHAEGPEFGWISEVVRASAEVGE